MLQNTFAKFISNYKKALRRWEKRHPIFNTFIVLIGVVMLWRGVWMLLDYLVFPNNALYSAIVSVFIGFLLLILDDFELDEL